MSGRIPNFSAVLVWALPGFYDLYIACMVSLLAPIVSAVKLAKKLNSAKLQNKKKISEFRSW